MTLRSPQTRTKLRAMYVLLADSEFRETVGYILGLLDLVDEMEADLVQGQAERRALAVNMTGDVLTDDQALMRLRSFIDMSGSTYTAAKAIGVSQAQMSMVVHRRRDPARVLGMIGLQRAWMEGTT